MNITILCKVVDNYGDIGFVYRLSRALSSLTQSSPRQSEQALINDIHLTLVVSNLTSFAFMAPGLDDKLAFQKYSGWDVLDWNNNEVCLDYCKKHDPLFILECFQCGRPEWLDKVLFDRSKKSTTHIVNVEYLTAEKWADDFHLLKSGTRSALVKKINFMPGFSEQTGGLVLDKEFITSLQNPGKAAETLMPFDIALSKNRTNITVFSYEQDFSSVVKAIEKYDSHAKNNSGKKIMVYLAPGLSAEPFKDAYRKNACTFDFVSLPRLPQKAWDALLCLCDVNFIRGEDSFSRAALSGKPYIWHAYKQDEEFQLVKTGALLERMKKYFTDNDYTTVYEIFMLYNRRYEQEPGYEAQEYLDKIHDEMIHSYGIHGKQTVSDGSQIMEKLLFDFLNRHDDFRKSFSSFAKDIISNGDLAEHLLQYLLSV